MDKTLRVVVFTFTVLSGLGGLACILEWLGIKPGDVRMTATIPHVLWLVFGLLLFAVSIFLSVLAWRGSGKTIAEATAQEKEEVRRLKDTLYESARSNLEYRGERDQCAKEKRVLQKQLEEANLQLAIFTPLQIEVFRLARELRVLYDRLVSLHPKEKISSNDPNYLKMFSEMWNPYERELSLVSSEYLLTIAPKVRDVVLQMRIAGCHVDHQIDRWFDHAPNDHYLGPLRTEIIAMAFELEDVKP